MDVLTAERAVVGFQCPGLVGKALPIVGSGPRQGENIVGEDVNGVHGLPELPVGKMGGAAKGVRKNNSRAIEKFPDFGNRGRCLSPHLGHRERASFKPGQM